MAYQPQAKAGAKGKGKGFGGRSLCLAKGSLPSVPYEVGVQVKLDNESGAAGLVDVNLRKCI